ncbi:MAG: lysylphosphatidylglycerol synthase transmembrane domain-containing protein [Thermodesulfovibrionia bacterium]|nr:lysylphosphatidylglycerol synthase transmembrane domain-containing protein [Thermodesulfovibrionia bacterium]
MRRKYLHLFIGLVIIVLSLFYAFRGVKFSELSNALTSVRYFYLLPAILLVIVSYWLRAMRWRYLIRPIKEVKTTNLFSPLMVGFMANMLPARAGEFVRAYLLSKKENLSFSSSLATVVIERLFDLALVLLLLCWVLIFKGDAFASEDTHNKMIYFGTLSFIVFFLILLFSALLHYKNDWAMKIVGFFIKPLSQKWREKIIRMVNSFTNGLNIIKDRRGFLATTFLSFLIWATFIVTYYPLYLAFDIETQLPVVSSLIILCLTVAIFITAAPTPGFLGSYHAACVAALHGIFGIEKAVALSYGIVAWLVAMGTTVVIGTIFAIKENISLGEFSSDREKIP